VWRVLQNLAGRHHPSTKSAVVTSYLDLEVGEPCTEFRRAESERVLRAQPFIASAKVRAVPDTTGGGVRIEVATVDEVPVTLGARIGGRSLEALSLGDGNIGGQGLAVELSGERGHAYRPGLGAQLTYYAMFSRPYVASLEVEQRPVGSLVAASLAYPFYTDLQRSTWHAAFRHEHVYMGIVRPAEDPLALSVRQTRWDVGGLLRERLFGEVAGIGALVSGTDVTPSDEGVVVSDSGLVPDTGATLNGRYAPFKATRPGVIAGLRIVRYVTVDGFNTLNAVEDLPEGVQLVGLVARGLPAAGASDLFLSGSFYAGRASPRSFLALQVEAEVRRDYERHRWDDLITSARLAWYIKQSPGALLILSDEFSGGRRPVLPLQLSLGSRDGGLRGYRGSTLAGAWRNVIRAEQRWNLGSLFGRGDFGVALFADGGTLWAGSAPYGDTTPFRVSVGASLLGAFPTGSRRLVRVDLAVPTTREGNDRWEVRFSVADLTRRFWKEPGDVARARTGPVPSTILTWPAR
jgi:hypothetical protein